MISILSILSPLAIAQNQNDIQYCIKRGVNYTELINFAKKLQIVVKNNDKKAAADFFKYPLIIYTESSKIPYLINNKKEFIENYGRIISPQMRKKLDTSDMGCNFEGIIGINNIGWAKTYQDSKIRIYQVYYEGDNPLIVDIKKLGKVVQPITDKKYLKQFVNLIKHSNLPENIKQQYMWNNNYNNITDNSSDSFTLYKADINNDGKAEYIITYMGGSGAYTGVGDIFNYVNGDLVHLRNPFGGERWYLFLADPFIVKKNGRYYLRFFNTEPAANCVYLWQNNTITLTSKNSKICNGVPSHNN